MKRIIYGGFLGFQAANDAPEGEFVELDEEIVEIDGELTSESLLVSEKLFEGCYVSSDMSKVICPGDDGFEDAAKAYQEAVENSDYVNAKNKAAAKVDRDPKEFSSMVAAARKAGIKKRKDIAKKQAERPSDKPDEKAKK